MWSARLIIFYLDFLFKIKKIHQSQIIECWVYRMTNKKKSSASSIKIIIHHTFINYSFLCCQCVRTTNDHLWFSTWILPAQEFVSKIFCWCHGKVHHEFVVYHRMTRLQSLFLFYWPKNCHWIWAFHLLNVVEFSHYINIPIYLYYGVYLLISRILRNN